MRLLLLAALVACGGYRTRPPAHVAAPGCTIEGTLIDISSSAADAPIVVAYVHHSFMPSDVVALWSDGAMVMSRERDVVQGSVAADDATRVARDVVAGIARSPDYAELPGPTDRPRVELFARDGNRWRHAFVWGASPGNYDRAPEGFVSAYRALLALRPATTSPFEPAEIELVYEPVDLGVPPVAWPADLPQPPPEGRSQIVDARYDAQLRALFAESHGHTPPRPVAFADRTWRIEITRRFRGQAVIDTVRECARRGT